MQSEITITNSSGSVVIDIEGVIGVPERMQFEQPGERVATYAKFTETLKKIAAIEAGRIEVNIRSSGGDVNDALLIYDALTGLGAEVVTRCYGYVASAATIIAQAASPGGREISANTLYLIHCSESAADGNTYSLSRTKELLDKTDGRIAAIYASRSGRAEAEFAELMNENNGKGRWMSAEEALAAGLADRVVPAAKVSNAGVVACMPEFDAVMAMLGLPQLPCRAGGGDEKGKLPRRILKAVVGLRCWLRGVSNQASAAQEQENTEEVKQSDKTKPPHVAAKAVIFQPPAKQSSARPTTTKPKEDPAPAGETVRTANEQAYEEDLQNFKK
jgi:ATP-dependent protease ClpP protease subunit